MGVDIHVYVERKTEGGWKPLTGIASDLEWLYEDRNYCLFSTLAGVKPRVEYPSIKEPVGLPKDLSEKVREEWEKYSYYGATYYSFNELLEAKVDWEDELLSPFKVRLDLLAGIIESNYCDLDDFRIVIWFDC